MGRDDCVLKEDVVEALLYSTYDGDVFFESNVHTTEEVWHDCIDDKWHDCHEDLWYDAQTFAETMPKSKQPRSTTKSNKLKV